MGGLVVVRALPRFRIYTLHDRFAILLRLCKQMQMVRPRGGFRSF